MCQSHEAESRFGYYRKSLSFFLLGLKKKTDVQRKKEKNKEIERKQQAMKTNKKERKKERKKETCHR